MTPQDSSLPLCVCRKPDCAIPYGFCHCRCGQKTNIAHCTITKIGWIGGWPIRFVRGHANRLPRQDFSDAAPFKIDGVYCNLIPLSRGLYAIANANRFEELNRLNWYALKAKNGFYAVRHEATKKKVTGAHIYMHRLIADLKKGDEPLGDHINGITLDNRDKNIRSVTQAQNSQNQSTHKDNRSGRKGVSWDRPRKKWRVDIRCNKKWYRLGRFDSFEEAVAVREAAEKKYHGEFARAERE